MPPPSDRAEPHNNCFIHSPVNTSLFSVIVANYDNGRFLPDLVKSVQAQTYTSWELIIVDDASTDESLRILSPFLADGRIRLIRHEINQGAGAAFRTAADKASGYVVGMLGADDALPPQSLEKMMAAHQAFPEAGLINSDCYECNPDLSIVRVYPGYRALQESEKLIENICVGSFAAFKRESYLKTSGFDTTQKKAVDHDIYLKLDEVGKLGYVHEPLYLYRNNPSGISQYANGLRAAQWSILACEKAYRRRLHTTKENLSREQYVQMMMTWYVREAFFYRKKDVAACNRLLARGAMAFPGLLGRKAFWSIFVRNNLGP